MTMMQASTDASTAPTVPIAAGERPRSVVPITDGLIGLAAVSLCWVAVMALRPPLLVAAWALLLAATAPMLACELARGTPAQRGSIAAGPVAWLVGFVLASAPFLFIHGQDSGLELWGLAWIVVAPAFGIRMILERNRSGMIAGGLPSALGRAVLTGRWSDLRDLAAPARLWALKAFFIPLYALSLITLIKLAYASSWSGPAGWLGLTVAFAYTIDVSFGLSGYLTASNSLIDTIRSTQNRLIGWVACVICYSPIIAHFPAFETVFAMEIMWPASTSANPLVVVGAISMLLLMALFVWATVCFGLRFCNLSDRGLISNGPYRWIKHPAYFAHACNAWVITVVLLPASGVALGPVELLAPVALSVVYWLRARTEEQHLSSNPDYVAYSGWIARHGLGAQLRRLVRLG